MELMIINHNCLKKHMNNKQIKKFNDDDKWLTWAQNSVNGIEVNDV